MVLDRLTELRKSKRWSLQYIADRLGIAKSTYAGYESGYREPSLEAVKMLADLFDTSVDFLLGRMDEPEFRAEKSTPASQELELRALNGISLTVDGITLKEQEVKHFIAFIRAMRELEKE